MIINKEEALEKINIIKKEELDKIVSLDRLDIEFANPLFKDREFALKLVSKSGGALSKLPHFQDDEEIVERAILEYPPAFKYASERLRSNEEIANKALNEYPSLLEFAGDNIKDNKEIVLNLVSKVGNSISFASPRLRNDKEVVLSAVKSNYKIIGKVNEQFSHDMDIVITAIQRNPLAYYYLPFDIRKEEKVVLTTLKGFLNNPVELNSFLTELTQYFNENEINELIEKSKK